MSREEQMALHDELADRLAAVLAELLDAERRAVARVDDKRRAELQSRIAHRDETVARASDRAVGCGDVRGDFGVINR